MPASISFADWDELGRHLVTLLTGLTVGEFVTVRHELPPEQAPAEVRRGLLGRRREVRVPSSEEYFAQVLATDETGGVAQLSGSTYAGGHHSTTEDEHARIEDLGWRVAGEPDFPGHAGGVYARRWAPDDVDALARAITGALEALGARPDVAWSLNRAS